MSDTGYSSSCVQLEQAPKTKENVWGNLEVLTEHVTHSAPRKHNFPGKKVKALCCFWIHATPIATPGEQPVFAG